MCPVLSKENKTENIDYNRRSHKRNSKNGDAEEVFGLECKWHEI
jgi:hypothetical protein